MDNLFKKTFALLDSLTDSLAEETAEFFEDKEIRAKNCSVRFVGGKIEIRGKVESVAVNGKLVFKLGESKDGKAKG